MFSPHDADISPLTLHPDNPAVGVQSLQADSGVGQVRHGSISIKELSAHAAECHLLMQLARARCRPELHSEQDEQDVAMWAQAKADALKALLAARRAMQAGDDEIRINDGAGYFAHQGELAAELLAKKAA